MSFTLIQFIEESNRIEGIAEVKQHEIEAHEKLLLASALTVPLLCDFVAAIALAQLRNRLGMNVMVGAHIPTPGGPHVEQHLDDLLLRVSEQAEHPINLHIEYETLHPFMDGNGRSGRAVWLWQMGGITKAPLGFLHHFYYQTLQAWRQHRGLTHP